MSRTRRRNDRRTSPHLKELSSPSDIEFIRLYPEYRWPQPKYARDGTHGHARIGVCPWPVGCRAGYEIRGTAIVKLLDDCMEGGMTGKAMRLTAKRMVKRDMADWRSGEFVEGKWSHDLLESRLHVRLPRHLR